MLGVTFTPKTGPAEARFLGSCSGRLGLGSRTGDGYEKSRFSEEQIAFALRESESGTPVEEVLPEAWGDAGDVLPMEEEVRRNGVNEVRLKQFEDENRTLKQLVRT